MATVCGIVIGDEILTGKVVDTNGPLLIRELRQRGATLKRLSVLRDDVDAIADEVRRGAAQFDYVITSGGVGPTHDDRTIEGICRAFDVQMVRHPRLEELLRSHLGDQISDAALKMADSPQGSRLIDDGQFPALAYRNVFILPGVPEIFAEKLSAICTLFQGTAPTVAQIYLRGYESLVAPYLQQVEREFSAVAVGSYPQRRRDDYSILITIEGPEATTVKDATTRMLQLVPQEYVVRVKSEEPDQ